MARQRECLVAEAEKEDPRFDSAEDEEYGDDRDFSDWGHNEDYFDYAYEYLNDGGDDCYYCDDDFEGYRSSSASQGSSRGILTTSRTCLYGLAHG
ncbi:hypothetical protein AC579_5595 [Pseudocercospora musae]|uniref:Uncharacterized protein n=1 Tax=Pseudocercospora musae TaxID=113226 RepID=A0A139IPD2_9PEZI|nr:hypothetical protein AC579_5595 [Pseudocercospora musae]